MLCFKLLKGFIVTLSCVELFFPLRWLRLMDNMLVTETFCLSQMICFRKVGTFCMTHGTCACLDL